MDLRLPSRARRRFMLLLCVGVVLVAACSTDSTYLPALLADPMAEFSHPQLAVETRAEREQGRSLIGMAEVDAQVFTGYLATGEIDPVVEDAIASAESSGWVFISPDPFIGDSGRTWSAEKEMPEGLATLSITVSEPGTQDWDIAISLKFEDGS